MARLPRSQGLDEIAALQQPIAPQVDPAQRCVDIHVLTSSGAGKVGLEWSQSCAVSFSPYAKAEDPKPDPQGPPPRGDHRAPVPVVRAVVRDRQEGRPLLPPAENLPHTSSPSASGETRRALVETGSGPGPRLRAVDVIAALHQHITHHGPRPGGSGSLGRRPQGDRSSDHRAGQPRTVPSWSRGVQAPLRSGRRLDERAAHAVATRYQLRAGPGQE